MGMYTYVNMGMYKCKLDKKYGIHTIELYAKNLKYIDVQKMIEYLYERDRIYKMKSDPYNIDRHVRGTYFVIDGIRLRIYQSYNKSNGVGFIINPSTFLSREYQPVKLWTPTSWGVDVLLERLDKALEPIKCDDLDVKDLSLSQMDLTRNIWYDKEQDLTPYIHRYHKCFIPRNFWVIHNKDKDVRKHLFVMRNKTVAVKAYDKIYELKKNDRCPKSLKDESILRVEVSLKREAFLKKLDLDRKDSLAEMLLAGYENGQKILNDYERKMFPFSGEFVKYDKAKTRIESKVKDSLLKEQMLYLLKKTSDSAGLSTAVRKLKDHYNIVDDRRIEKIFAEFDKLRIAPITIPKE